MTTISDIEDLFQFLISDITGLDTDKGVRISWPTGGAPAWKITDNIVFLQVSPVDDQINRQRDVSTYWSDGSPSVFTKETSYTRVIEVKCIIYGPEAFENAVKIKDGIFNQENHDTLAKEKIYLIPDIQEIKRASELFEGQWWTRYDLDLRFNQLVMATEEITQIESVEIIMESKQGTSTSNV